MKRITTFLFAVFLFSGLARSQGDTIPHLIISEARHMGAQNSWYELTNMGDTALNLSSFGVGTAWRDQTTFVFDENGILRPIGSGSPSNDQALFAWMPDTLLLPGESWVIMAVSDAPQGEDYPESQMTNWFNEDKLKYADFLCHAEEPGLPVYLHKPEAESYGWDSVSVHWRMLHINTLHGPILWYRTKTDSFLIDRGYSPVNTDNVFTRTVGSIAGIDRAVETHVYCRKFEIKKGNTNWDNSRGVSAEDSEWVLYPFHSGRMVYHTLGNHGVYDVFATSEILDIDLDAETISVPWGTQKGDSIILDMQLGDGMAWDYIEDTTSVEDSTHTICQDGDILILYAVGNTLQTKNMKISVGDAPANLAEVFSKRVKRYPDPINDPIGVWRTPYYVTEGDPVIDTIRRVAFATRVDTLLQYLEKAPGASWDIEWVDGVERVDLKLGDLLAVTAKDGTTTKKYYIKVDEYAPVSNASLASITWPDYPAEDLLEWNTGDTIPGFAAKNTGYVVTLPFGMTNVPAIAAKAEDPNAKIKIARAVSLAGGIEERTTTITVTAEDDTTINVYTVLFKVEILPENVQPFVGDPIISEVIRGAVGTGFDCIELFNPGDVALDLSQYLLVSSTKTNPAEVIAEYYGSGPTDSANYVSRWRRYVPGYKWADYATWQQEGWIMHLDPIVNPVVEAKGVFLLSDIWNPVVQNRYNQYPWLIDLANVTFSRFEAQKEGTPLNTWNEHIEANQHAAYNDWTWNTYLFKIVNDSVVNGTKPLLNNLEDYKLVDCFGQYAPTDSIAGRDVSVLIRDWDFRRKPGVYKGVTGLEEDWGTDAESSAWIVYFRNDPGTELAVMLGNGGIHNWAPLTHHLSKVSSLIYKVSQGWKDLQTIRGDMASTDVSGLYTNLIKADANQALEVHSSADGSIKAAGAAIAGGDTLYSTSADGSATTLYLIQNNPLSSDAMLTAKEGSGLVISVDGSTGSITGMNYGVTLSSVLENVIVPDLAVLNVVDDSNELVPQKVLNFDTVYVSTLVNGSFFFEVVAENGNTILYHLMPEALSSDAFVISSVFTVDQAGMRIHGMPDGIAVSAFFANIKAVKGATVKLIDKLGHERPLGVMAYDDLLRVTSEDLSKTVTYYLDFLMESDPDWAVAIREITRPARAGMLVYPNPASEMISIELDEPLSDRTTLRIFSISGALIDARQLDQGISRYQIDLDGYRPGVYYLQMTRGNRSIATQKLIVQ